MEKPKQEEDDRLRSENFHFVQADVGVSTEAERIVQETLQRFGDKIHVLINNAGMFSLITYDFKSVSICPNPYFPI